MLIYPLAYVLSMNNEERIEEFVEHLAAHGRTADYQMCARGILRQLSVDMGRDFERLTKNDMEGWMARLRGRGLSDNTVKGKLGYARTFLRWLNDGENPPALKGLKIGVKTPRVASKNELLSESEYERLVSVMPLRKAVIFRLLWSSGARPSEILGLRRDDVAFHKENGREYVELSLRETKNEIPRVVPIADRETMKTLRSYMETQNGELLFSSPMSKWKGEEIPERPLQYTGLWRYLRRVAKEVGITKRIYPYLIRHTVATRHYDAPPGIRDMLMGWRSPAMWKNYEHLAVDDVRDYIFEREGSQGELTEEESRQALTRLLSRVATDSEFADNILKLVEGE